MDILTLYTVLMLPIFAAIAPPSAGTVVPSFGTASIIEFVPWSTRPAPPPVRDGRRVLYSGRAELSFVNTTGNTSTQTIGTAGSFQVRPDLWLFSVDAAFVRSTTQDELQAESLTVQTRAARALSPRVDAYGQTQYLRNTFAGLRHQAGVELGLATRLTEPLSTTHKLHAEVAFGYINENRVEDEDRVLSSATIGARYIWALSKTAEFSDDAFYITNVNDVSDWRLRNTASIAANLSSIFSLKFSHVLSYLREPVTGFRQTDTLTSAAIVAKF